MDVLKRTLQVASIPLLLAGTAIGGVVTLGGFVILYPTVGTAYYIATGEHIPCEYVILPAYINKKIEEHHMKNMTFTHKCGAKYKMSDATFKLDTCDTCGEKFENDIIRRLKEKYSKSKNL